MTNSTSKTFKSNNRIRKRAEFIHLHLTGNKHGSSILAISWLPSTNNFSRLGLVVSTKVSKRAVIRNRIKRQLREFFRQQQANFTGNFDIVLVARPKITSCSSQEIRAACLKLLSKEKILEVQS